MNTIARTPKNIMQSNARLDRTSDLVFGQKMLDFKASLSVPRPSAMCLIVSVTKCWAKNWHKTMSKGKYCKEE